MYREQIGRVAAIVLLLFNSCSLASAMYLFNPSDFEKQFVACQAIKRIPNNEVVNITLSYVDINPQAEKTILMVHGWPGLWNTWVYQIQEFESDHHLVVPDLRGFGESTHPGDVRSSGTMGDLVGDLICILENAQVTSAICMGHDWGSQLCYEAARMRPDIFTAVVGAVVPYIPSAGPFVPVKDLTALLPRLTYQLYFDSKTDLAVLELDKDIRSSIRAVLRTVDSPPPPEFLTSPDSFLDAWGNVTTIPPVPFFTSDDENYMVEQYSIQGFKNTLEFYTQENRYASWELAHAEANYSVPQPVLAIYPINDPVANWTAAAQILKSEEFTPHVTVVELDGAHWVHLENSRKFNTAVRKWLQELDSRDSRPGEDRPNDEL